MVEKVDLFIQRNNYNTISRLKSCGNRNFQQEDFYSNNPSFGTAIPINDSVNKSNIRTELSSKQEKKQYKELLSKLDRNSRKNLELLLKTGILLNSESDDKSTVLENLYKILTEKRASGLDNINILKDTIGTISYPYKITQQFGDIPKKYMPEVLDANNKTISDKKYDVNVEHSGTCVAASTEFKLAKQRPAEFARFANELSSEKLSVTKNIKLENLADNTLNGVWLLNAFEIPYEMKDYNNVELKFAPDKNAIIRAKIQTNDKDPYERTALDVLMQSTFMQIGSQQSYNTLTDRRAGKFNQNDKGLIEFEKTFTESVVFDKNILSVTYQTVDENARLIGYETDLETLKKHLTTAIDMGENVILGYTQTNSNNVIVNGHEITIVDYKKDLDGKLTFICNDTDDGISKPIEYSEDFLLPKIHHAALPKEIVESDMNIVPSWKEGLEVYKNLKNIQNQAA